jgi:hypothetical protein
MSYHPNLGIPPDCDGCGQIERNMIETYWASGNKHYCAACWPRHRDFYEDECNYRGWKHNGRYFAPVD